MSEKNYQFRERMLEVHKKDRRMPYAKVKDGQVEIDNSWIIYIPARDDRVIYNAARDLEDYFAVSMGVYIKVQIGGDIPDKSIVYKTDDALKGTQYRIEVTNNRIILSGGTSRTVAQAGYYIEDLMNFEEGPYLYIQDTVKEPLYDTRMTHSGFGLDLFPDQHLNFIAHAGYTAIVLFVRGYNDAGLGYRDFNDIIYRAAGYGLDVFMYGYMKSVVYPEGEKAQAYYDKIYGDLFRKCPFKGLVLVGESCEFHSRDERTTGKLRRENLDENGEKIIKDKPNPGWWPCWDYPLLLNMIKKSVRDAKPDAEIVFWTYNWSGKPVEPRLELIRNVPKDITVEVTFVKDAKVEHDGVIDQAVDYNIYFVGPGMPFTTEAEEIKKCGLRFYAMTNTAGATWDMGVIPYVPAPQQWMLRYEQMRKYHDTCGLTGLMESHHFGIYPSFIVDLAKWMFHSPDTPEEEILRKIATRDFCEEVSDKVIEAYNEFSEGIRHTVTNNDDQYGPYRVGPAYPLLVEKNYILPSEPYTRFPGNAICRTLYNKYRLETEYDFKKIEHELDFAKIALKHYERGADILESIIPLIPESKRDEAKRLAYLGRFMARTVQTTINTKNWHIAKKKGEWDKMPSIAKAEIENARATIPIVEFDSRLGFEPSMEYMTDTAHIEWKIKVTQEVLENEVLPKIAKQ